MQTKDLNKNESEDDTQSESADKQPKHKFRLKKFSELSTLKKLIVIIIAVVLLVKGIYYARYSTYKYGFRIDSVLIQKDAENKIGKTLPDNDTYYNSFVSVDLKRNKSVKEETSEAHTSDGKYKPYILRTIDWDNDYTFAFEGNDKFDKLRIEAKIAELSNLYIAIEPTFKEIKDNHVRLWAKRDYNTISTSEYFHTGHKPKIGYSGTIEWIRVSFEPTVSINTTDHTYVYSSTDSLYIDGELTFTQEYLEREKEREKEERQAAWRKEMERRKEEAAEKKKEEEHKKWAEENKKKSSNSSLNDFNLNDDVYDIEDYLDAEDFADEWEEEFDSWDDAYDYYEDWEWEQSKKNKGSK